MQLRKKKSYFTYIGLHANSIGICPYMWSMEKICHITMQKLFGSNYQRCLTFLKQTDINHKMDVGMGWEEY